MNKSILIIGFLAFFVFAGNSGKRVNKEIFNTALLPTSASYARFLGISEGRAYAENFLIQLNSMRKELRREIIWVPISELDTITLWKLVDEQRNYQDSILKLKPNIPKFKLPEMKLIEKDSTLIK
jgi:hypothetical protein